RHGQRAAPVDALNRSPHPLTLLTPEGGNNRAQASKNNEISEAVAIHGAWRFILSWDVNIAVYPAAIMMLAGRSPDSGDLRAAECEQQRPRFLSRVLYWTP
ncbi:MAG: hypothetical protein ACXWVR_08270, partial [Rhodoplanes sp.]